MDTMASSVFQPSLRSVSRPQGEVYRRLASIRTRYQAIFSCFYFLFKRREDLVSIIHPFSSFLTLLHLYYSSKQYLHHVFDSLYHSCSWLCHGPYELEACISQLICPILHTFFFIRNLSPEEDLKNFYRILSSFLIFLLQILSCMV